MIKKTAENYHYYYVAEKRIVSKQSQISIPNFNRTNEDFNEDSVSISSPYFLNILRNEPSKSIKVGSSLTGPVHRFK